MIRPGAYAPLRGLHSLGRSPFRDQPLRGGALPRLALKLTGYIWYNVRQVNFRFRTEGLHLTSSRPCRAYLSTGAAEDAVF
jgi:hypothetical protein